MNFLTRYLLLLIVLISSEKFGFAQDSSQTGTKGEIVMTKTELQSFLNNIAELKKQHIARQETATHKRELKLQELNEAYTSGNVQTGVRPESRTYRNGEFPTSVQQYNFVDEQMLFKELELINARLNSLMLEMEVLKINAQLNEPTASPSVNLPTTRSTQRQPKIHIMPEQQPVIIQQETPPQVYGNQGPQERLIAGSRNKRGEQPLQEEPSNDSLLVARQNEQLVLKNQIKSLENEMSLLQQLLKGSGGEEKNKYNKDISNLNAQIDALSSQLAKNNEEADSLKLKKQNSLMNVLNDFSYNVYFKNNSTMVPSSDYSKLQEIVNIAGQHPQMTVVLRGFASKVGNPQYNEKISFQRAASVKEWLLDNGINLKNIITMHHGVDKSVDASRARRVEITFKVQ